MSSLQGAERPSLVSPVEPVHPNSGWSSVMEHLLQHPEDVSLPPRWNYHKVDTFEGDRIIYCEVNVASDGTSPVVTKHVTVYGDHRDQPLEAFILKTSLGDLLDTAGKPATVQDVASLIQTIDNIPMCRGGPKHASYPNVRPECAFVDPLGVWRHSKCDVYGSQQCSNCTSLKNTLYRHATRQRKRKQTDRVRLALSPAKKAKVQLFRRTRTILSKRMSSLRNRQALLERELQRSQEALIKMKQEQFHSVLAHLPEAQRLVVRECIQMSKCATPKGHRYSSNFLTMCMLLHIRSPASYSFLRESKLLPLPAVSTVRRYISMVTTESGFDETFLGAFKRKMARKTDIQRHGMLVFDEIQVRQGRDVNAGTMTYIGQVEGNEKDGPQLADHGLVFLFVPFADSYAQPVGVFASKGPTKGVELAKLVLQAISLLEAAGVFVDGLVCDGAATNRSLWNHLGVSGKLGNLRHTFENPVCPERRVFVFSDAPHLMKCIRNRICKSKLLKAGGAESGEIL
ncbi:hypothetical protein HPB48_012123 [Haemaphysalis longicornis]|uniref:Transposable element P transposase-like RNase H domain-containing protein n=1 Tax=Haemaphysalis longicornis TaxID=44386 RepID=A0A9J6FMS3_HAELO|nr:hypothetical protein HPB48_012123 [Haemaphysalis longicornis]